MLNEAFRVFIIESAILGNWLYAAFDIAPRALSSLVCSCAVAWIALGNQKGRNVAVAVLLIAGLEVFVIHPGLDALCTSFKSSLPEPMPLYTDPYPFKINLVVYATFIEPTIAAFVMVSMCWTALGESRLRWILAFTALLLLVRGRFIGLFVESFWVKQSLPVAFLAESQFFLETLVLGLLVALAWSYAPRNAMKIGVTEEMGSVLIYPPNSFAKSRANRPIFRPSRSWRPDMTDIAAAGVYPLGDRSVNRLGYGAMQLAGPGVFGPPKDRAAAVAVLREAVARGVNHIDTSDYYGPHITNQIIREALHPYPKDLVIVTKVGAMRGDDASWKPAMAPADLSAPSTTICGTWASMRWMSSICGSWGAYTRQAKDRSRSRSPRWRNCRNKA